ATVHVKNASAKKAFREADRIEINLGDYTTVTPSDARLEIKDEFPAPEAGGARVSAEHKLRDLREGQSSVTVVGRVLDLREKTISTANGQKTLVEGELADETGRAPFSAWEPEKLPAEMKQNSVVRVKGAYVRSFRGIPNLNFGQYATVEVLPDRTLPNAEELDKPKPFHLGELEAAGGGQGVMVEGVVLEVKKGSGLIFRCGAEGCNRVLQKMECRVHGKQKGQPDLRIKAVLDDGHGAATFFANREATEKLLGKTLAQCQEMARDAMTIDVVYDEIVPKLTARRVVLTGNASHDEYGLQILAGDLAFAPERDAEAEAEKLYGSIVEILQEVGPQ